MATRQQRGNKQIAGTNSNEAIRAAIGLCLENANADHGNNILTTNCCRQFDPRSNFCLLCLMCLKIKYIQSLILGRARRPGGAAKDGWSECVWSCRFHFQLEICRSALSTGDYSSGPFLSRRSEPVRVWIQTCCQGVWDSFWVWVTVDFW